MSDDLDFAPKPKAPFVTIHPDGRIVIEGTVHVVGDIIIYPDKECYSTYSVVDNAD